jgi:signal transduction histidine kinase
VAPLPASAEPKRVLLLNSYGANFSPFGDYLASLRTELARRSPYPVDIHDASVASARFAEDQRDDAFTNYLLALFQGKPLDLVIAVGGPAARYAQQYRSRLFPSLPLLITAIDERRVNPAALSEKDAVVPGRLELRPILDNILRLLPDTANIAVVLGNSPNEKFWLQQIRTELGEFATRFNWIWLNDLSLGEMQARLATLPPKSAVFFPLLNVDGAGVPYEGNKAFIELHAVANAPIFGVDNVNFGRGIVGGPLILVDEIGGAAADAAVRILRGEAPARIRPAGIGFASPRYDARELARWNISEDVLPAGSTVEFRQPTLWEEYRWQLSLMAAVTLVQAALIAGLLIERRRRRVVEGESERRLVQLAHVNRTAAVRAISASIAHEINQPLAAILNNAEAAEIVLSRSPLNIELLKEILADIRQADQRASNIVGGLRKLLKFRAAERQIVDMAVIVNNVVQLLGAEARANGVEIVVDCVAGTFPVRADPIHLEQVLLNLGLNAVQAISTSGSAARRIVFKIVRPDESNVEVSIIDTGSGIPEDILKNLFEPFYTTKPDGTGLGLSIVRTIVETYGGKMRAGNNAGAGATFSFTLPLSEQQVEAA